MGNDAFAEGCNSAGAYADLKLSDLKLSDLKLLGYLQLNQLRKVDESKMSLVRVLVVDDFSLWQSFVIEQVAQDSNMCVVGFASDGLEAVQKAEELQPDLILLDVGLPKLDGIEAARQIRKSVPKAKILFLSSNSDANVVRSALGAGGHGYVLKWEAGIALLPAMQAVLLGKQFVSIGLMAIDGLTDLQE